MAKHSNDDRDRKVGKPKPKIRNRVGDAAAKKANAEYQVVQTSQSAKDGLGELLKQTGKADLQRQQEELAVFALETQAQINRDNAAALGKFAKNLMSGIVGRHQTLEEAHDKFHSEIVEAEVVEPLVLPGVEVEEGDDLSAILGAAWSLPSSNDVAALPSSESSEEEVTQQSSNQQEESFEAERPEGW